MSYRDNIIILLEELTEISNDSICYRKANREKRVFKLRDTFGGVASKDALEISIYLDCNNKQIDILKKQYVSPVYLTYDECYKQMFNELVRWTTLSVPNKETSFKIYSCAELITLDKID